MFYVVVVVIWSSCFDWYNDGKPWLSKGKGIILPSFLGILGKPSGTLWDTLGSPVIVLNEQC